MTRTDPGTALWVRRFHPSPAASRQLVCFPHAGGSASFYFPISRALAPTTDVLAIQYPGRQDRCAEPCVEDVTSLADAATAALLPVLDRPVALFGHSMGAAVAFEVATRLERAAIAPVVLFVSGCRAPSRPCEGVLHLQDDDTLIAEIERLGGAGSQVLQDAEILRLVLPAIRSDYRAAETYRWHGGTPLTVPIHAHVGDADPDAPLADVRTWESHTTGGFRMRTYPGGHFYLVDRAPELVAAIEAVLAGAG
ncbi:thioesterase II family protein [Amycolatopsis sp. cmx-4-68]|uniref:thioesterase II family protein n=1 Tax=Amycolatopsis sp. cmx-4-68 TaxID=2790938 RepID=UPI00397A1E02